MLVVISSHALAREALRDPDAGLCISAHRVARQADYPDHRTRLRFDGAMLVRALLQEAGEPFSVWSARCAHFPLTLGDGTWSSADAEDFRMRLADRLLAAPDRRLVLPENCSRPYRYDRPSYIETR